MDIHNGDLHSVVESLARSGNIHIAGTETLEGRITIRIEDEEPLAAIERIGRIKHFIVEQEEGIVVVRGSKRVEEERVIRSIHPRYIRPEKMRTLIGLIVPKDRIVDISETNQVFYYGTPEEEMSVRELVEKFDAPPKQIHLEVAVVAMEHSFQKEMGIQWSWLGLHHGSTGKGNETSASIRFGRAADGSPYQFLFQPQLSAHESNGNTVLIARPSIVTLNGEEGKILIGDRVPVSVETVQDGVTRTSIRYEEAGIRLTYKPYIMDNQIIDVELLAEVSNPSLVSEMKAYRITTREAKTRVQIHDGDVLVIGGLMDSRSMEQMQKIPFLGDIPLLGKLFRHARKTKDKVELFILVKAKVL